MKKKLLGILILPTLVMAGITGEGSSQTKTFGKSYSVEAHSNSALDVMYSGENNAGETFNRSILSEGVREGSSYSALELMYEAGTGSTKYAKGGEVLEERTTKRETPMALELMYSRVS